MNDIMSATLRVVALGVLGSGVLSSGAIAQDAIAWSKAVDGALPKAAANDTRPTILYFTFDT